MAPGQAYLTQNQGQHRCRRWGRPPHLARSGRRERADEPHLPLLPRTDPDRGRGRAPGGGERRRIVGAGAASDQSTEGAGPRPRSAPRSSPRRVTLGEDVLVRFTANDDDAQSIVEAGVDGVRLSSWCDPSGVGTSYCQANTNSSGSVGTLRGTGSASLSANDLVLVAEQLPPDQFTLVIVSRTAGFAPLGLGNLCVAGEIGRDLGSLQNSGAAGAVTRAVDWSAIPSQPASCPQRSVRPGGSRSGTARSSRDSGRRT